MEIGHFSFIHYLSYKITEEELQQAFGDFGEVESAKIINKKSIEY